MESIVYKKAFLFPGQGSQFVGMGLDVYGKYPLAKNMYSIANKVLGCRIDKISFYDLENNLNRTLFTQPAIFVHSAILSTILQKHKVIPNCVAGHSLGEITALFAANAISFEDALHLVKIRAKLMEECNYKNLGSMAVVLNASKQELDNLCNQKGVIVKANFNSDSQVILSGEDKCIEHAINVGKKLKIKIKKLNVSGAFHSPLMNDAKINITSAIKSLNFNKPTIPIFQNLTGKCSMNLSEIKSNLINQIENPVLWKNIIRQMDKDNINYFYEIGPKNVLTNLTKRILHQPKTISIQTIGDLVAECQIK